MGETINLREITLNEFRELEKQRRIKQVSAPLSIECNGCTLEQGIDREIQRSTRLKGRAYAFMKGKPGQGSWERHEQVDSSGSYDIYPVVLYKIS